MTQQPEPAAEPIGSAIYRIRLRGQLDPLWSHWFDGLLIAWRDGDSLLTGPVADQAALHGLVRKIRDLGVTLISINRLDASSELDQGTNERGED